MARDPILIEGELPKIGNRAYYAHIVHIMRTKTYLMGVPDQNIFYFYQIIVKYLYGFSSEVQVVQFHSFLLGL